MCIGDHWDLETSNVGTLCFSKIFYGFHSVGSCSVLALLDVVIPLFAKGIKNVGHVGPQHATLRYLRSYGKLPPVIPMSFPLRPGGHFNRRILEWIYPHLPAVLGELSFASPYQQIITT